MAGSIQRLRTGIAIVESRVKYGWRFRSYGERVILETPYRLLGARHIHLGDRVRIRAGARLEAFVPSDGGGRETPHMILGDGVAIGQYSHIICVDEITIGSNTLITAFVTIVDSEHGYSPQDYDTPPAFRVLRSAPTSIGAKCWVGNGAVITAGVRIGDNVTVGANAVVTHDVPSGQVVAGVPAREL